MAQDARQPSKKLRKSGSRIASEGVPDIVKRKLGNKSLGRKNALAAVRSKG